MSKSTKTRATKNVLSQETKQANPLSPNEQPAEKKQTIKEKQEERDNKECEIYKVLL